MMRVKMMCAQCLCGWVSSERVWPELESFSRAWRRSAVRMWKRFSANLETSCQRFAEPREYGYNGIFEPHGNIFTGILKVLELNATWLLSRQKLLSMCCLSPISWNNFPKIEYNSLASLQRFISLPLVVCLRSCHSNHAYANAVVNVHLCA